MPHSMDNTDVDTGLMCLVKIARFHGVAAEADQLAHSHGDFQNLFDQQSITLAGRSLGLKIKPIHSTWERLGKMPLPSIAQYKDGRYVLLAGIRDDKVLVQDPLEKRLLALPKDIFESAWNGSLILVTKRPGISNMAGKFGFSWFIPAIVKHRKLFTEVLVASFFLQLFALITPLFFQVVIDKVLTHRGLTTLDVLAVGLLAVSFFEVLLGGLRTYVFTHTANRVDVSLGAKLFNHLLRLPLAYFEARRVGDSVARAYVSWKIYAIF